LNTQQNANSIAVDPLGTADIPPKKRPSQSSLLDYNPRSCITQQHHHESQDTDLFSNEVIARKQTKVRSDPELPQRSNFIVSHPKGGAGYGTETEIEADMEEESNFDTEMTLEAEMESEARGEDDANTTQSEPGNLPFSSLQLFLPIDTDVSKVSHSFDAIGVDSIISGSATNMLLDEYHHSSDFIYPDDGKDIAASDDLDSNDEQNTIREGIT
jgi:hypothetical protein